MLEQKAARAKAEVLEAREAGSLALASIGLKADVRGCQAATYQIEQLWTFVVITRLRNVLLCG